MLRENTAVSPLFFPWIFFLNLLRFRILGFAPPNPFFFWCPAPVPHRHTPFYVTPPPFFFIVFFRTPGPFFRYSPHDSSLLPCLVFFFYSTSFFDSSMFVPRVSISISAKAVLRAVFSPHRPATAHVSLTPLRAPQAPSVFQMSIPVRRVPLNPPPLRDFSPPLRLAQEFFPQTLHLLFFIFCPWVTPLSLSDCPSFQDSYPTPPPPAPNNRFPLPLCQTPTQHLAFTPPPPHRKRFSPKS